jgi:hypothetical protein
MFRAQAEAEPEVWFIRLFRHSAGCNQDSKQCIDRQKKCTGESGAFLLAEKDSLGFEFTTRFFTLGLGALDPTLAGAGVLTRTAGGCGCAGAGALA